VRPASAGCLAQPIFRSSPGAKALYQYRTSRTDLYLRSWVAAHDRALVLNAPGFEIVEAPELKSIFILNIAGPHSWRVIYMDGRTHPAAEELRPTFSELR